MRSNKNNTEKFLINWVKKGDFSKTFSSEGQLIRKVEYENVTHEPKAEIFIGGYSCGEIKIIFQSNQLINAFLDKCKEVKLFVDGDFCKKECDYIDILTTSASKQDKTRLVQFLHCIDSGIPLGKKIKKEIFNSLNLEHIADEKSFYKNLEKLIDEDKFEQVAKIAQTEKFRP